MWLLRGKAGSDTNAPPYAPQNAEVSQRGNEGSLLFSSSSSPAFISVLSLRSATPAAAPGISHERDRREATMRFATKIDPKSRLTATIAFVVVSILSTLSADMFSQ